MSIAGTWHGCTWVLWHLLLHSHCGRTNTAQPSAPSIFTFRFPQGNDFHVSRRDDFWVGEAATGLARWRSEWWGTVALPKGLVAAAHLFQAEIGTSADEAAGVTSTMRKRAALRCLL